MRWLVAVVLAVLAAVAAGEGREDAFEVEVDEVAGVRQDNEERRSMTWANSQDLCNPIIANLEEILQERNLDARLTKTGLGKTVQAVGTSRGPVRVPLTLRGMTLRNVGSMRRQTAGVANTNQHRLSCSVTFNNIIATSSFAIYFPGIWRIPRNYASGAVKTAHTINIDFNAIIGDDKQLMDDLISVKSDVIKTRLVEANVGSRNKLLFETVLLNGMTSAVDKILEDDLMTALLPNILHSLIPDKK